MASTESAQTLTDCQETATDNNTTESNHPSEPLNPNLVPGARAKQKVSDTLPPLVFGTATFNYQFNEDPFALQPSDIVKAALEQGVRAFDTSPYYGPAEEILGAALHSDLIQADPVLQNLKRYDYHILTKCGRLPGKGDEFDYSPEWIKHSIKRSLKRLATTYLDVVYLHDVEFVSPAEVLSGIRTLRSIRDTDATIRYVGICGYPVETLCEVSEMILHETNEPIDIVQSYANFTIQNQRLLTHGLDRLQAARVDVVANASLLGMGLCRSQGVPTGTSKGSWHPSPDGLREKCAEAAQWVAQTHHEQLETVALRFGMEKWLTLGRHVGSHGLVPTSAIATLTNNSPPREPDITLGAPSTRPPRLGVNVIGVSQLSELNDTMTVYNAILSDQMSSSRPHPTEPTKSQP